MKKGVHWAFDNLKKNAPIRHKKKKHIVKKNEEKANDNDNEINVGDKEVEAFKPNTELEKLAEKDVKFEVYKNTEGK